MPGLRIKLWPIFAVQKHPWVQVPAGEIGVVIAQVGAALPIGAKSGVYQSAFGNFSNLRQFIELGGQKGVQRPVLPPGTLMPVHPVAFLVLTPQAVYGLPVSPDLVSRHAGDRAACSSPESFGLAPEQLRVVVIAPQGPLDMVGIVTVLEGEPLHSGDIASRLGGYEDIARDGGRRRRRRRPRPTPKVIEMLLGSKNDLHNNYQDFQAFLEHGGKIGLQHDPLLYGAYLLNPFLVRVEMVPMLVVNQGEVAVIKAFVGLPTLDTSGTEFKFGSIVRPGHRGIWQEPLRTGKYPINPRCYAAEIVPTSILTLNWSERVERVAQPRRAARADRREEPRGLRLLDRAAGADPRARHEGAEGDLDGRHDAQPRQRGAAVGRRQPLPQHAAGPARGHVHRDPHAGAGLPRSSTSPSTCSSTRSRRRASTSRTCIFPPELVDGADQARDRQPGEGDATRRCSAPQTSRIEMEKAKGTADMQGQLATVAGERRDRAEPGRARVRREAQGEAAYVELTGRAEATRVEAIGLANATATEALGVARADRLRGAEGSARRDRDRARRGGERGVRGPHHGRARGARHRRRRQLRGARGHAHAHARRRSGAATGTAAAAPGCRARPQLDEPAEPGDAPPAGRGDRRRRRRPRSRPRTTISPNVRPPTGSE